VTDIQNRTNLKALNLEGDSNRHRTASLEDGLREGEEQQREPDDEDEQKQNDPSETVLDQRLAFLSALNGICLKRCDHAHHMDSIVFNFNFY